MKEGRFFCPSSQRQLKGTRQGGAQPKASNTLTGIPTILPQEERAKDLDGLDRLKADEIQGTLRPYTPDSWFHPVGICKARARILPRIPDLKGCLFLTLTVNPHLFAGPASAYDRSQDRIRRMFHRLRRGVKWKGKIYKVDAAYFRKVEFHRNGFAHFHILFLTRRFIPGDLLNHLWQMGRTNIERISNRDFEYLLKYVSKSGDFPDWVKERKRLRIIQASHGFYRELEKVNERESQNRDLNPFSISKKRFSLTIGERIERWKRLALYQEKERFWQIELPKPFWELLGELILSIAQAGNYLGNGLIQILNRKDLIIWILNPKEMTSKTSRFQRVESTFAEW